MPGIVTISLTVVVLAVEVLVIGRRPDESTMGERGLFIILLVWLTVLLWTGILLISGPRSGGEFSGGRLTGVLPVTTVASPVRSQHPRTGEGSAGERFSPARGSGSPGCRSTRTLTT